jgi:hypothetical protein
MRLCEFAPAVSYVRRASDRGLIARQITEAFPWDKAPRYLIRDRDQVYGAAATRRLRAMGIRDKPIAPGSPWQTDVIDKRFLGCRLLCCRGARATAWPRAGFEVRALPRSHYCRSSFAAIIVAPLLQRSWAPLGHFGSSRRQTAHRSSRPVERVCVPDRGWP